MKTDMQCNQWQSGDNQDIDPSISCAACDAVCCRLTVVILPGDNVPPHLTERSEHGPEVMARDEDGWCVAVDQSRMCCSIYESRPTVCRSFAMGSAHCRSEREIYTHGHDRLIPMTVIV